MKTHRTNAQLLGLVIILAFTTSAFLCNGSKTKNLATASDSLAHALSDAQQAAKQAVASGVITSADEQEFETYLVRASQAGMILDNGIRQGEKAQDIAAQTNAFLDAFNMLNTRGVAGIKNPNVQLTISTILNGAETSIAIIVATVGKGK